MKKLALLLCSVFTLAGISGNASSDTIFEDNFDTENDGSAPVSNYTRFANWDVEGGGTVDLFKDGVWDVECSGMCVDLDGSTNIPGKLTTKSVFDLTAGTYELQFDVKGPTIEQGQETLNVFLGTTVLKTLTKASLDPFTTETITFTLGALTSGRISFLNGGNNSIGIILDNVRLSSVAVSTVPIPAAAWLMFSGLAAFTMVGRRNRKLSCEHA